MANKITETNIKPQNSLVNKTSRYADAIVIYYGSHNKITYKTYKKTIVPSAKGDRFTVITSATEYRPDLVSRQAYGVVDFWWKIMETNNIKDVFEFSAGKTIRIPENFF